MWGRRSLLRGCWNTGTGRCWRPCSWRCSVLGLTGSEHLDLVGDVPACCRRDWTRWLQRCLLTQCVLWFYDFNICTCLMWHLPTPANVILRLSFQWSPGADRIFSHPSSELPWYAQLPVQRIFTACSYQNRRSDIFGHFVPVHWTKSSKNIICP